MKQAWKWGIAKLGVMAVVVVGCLIMAGCGDSEEPLPDAELDQALPAPTSSLSSSDKQSTVTTTVQTPAVKQAAPSVPQPVNVASHQATTASESTHAQPVATPSSKASVTRDQSTPEGHYGGFHVKLARTPWPRNGEAFDQPIKPTLLVDADTVAAMDSMGAKQAKPDQIIPWDQARLYVDQEITIEGKVILTNTNRTRTVCFLNFIQEWRGRFYVILFKDVLDEWPDAPDKYFLNKTIRVKGKVVDRKGVPQMQVSKASQITIVQ
jgi:hypothetical protein